MEKLYRIPALILILWTVSLYSLNITLEHAIHPEEIAWGLMGRTELPANHGMAFTLPKKNIVNIWMFNCFIDLSVAFLNEKHVIQEIYELKAYPEYMDPLRPVYHVEEIALKYPPGDPVRKFFLSKTVRSTKPAKYFVEMPSSWFAENKVVPGDKIVWKGRSPQARVVKH